MSKFNASSSASLALLMLVSIPLTICTAFLAMLAFPLFMVLVALSAAGPFCRDLHACAHLRIHEALAAGPACGNSGRGRLSPPSELRPLWKPSAHGQDPMGLPEHRSCEQQESAPPLKHCVSGQTRHANPLAVHVPQPCLSPELVLLSPASPLPSDLPAGASQPTSPATPPQRCSIEQSVCGSHAHAALPSPVLASHSPLGPIASSSPSCALSNSRPPSPHMPAQRLDRQGATTARATAQPAHEPGCEGTAGEPCAPQPLLDGSLLATCKELGALGKGAYGVVDRVRVTPASGPSFEAARKRIPVHDAESRKQFEAEVDALKAGLGCPYVVQLLDARSTASHHEILMELLQGGTLEDEQMSAPRFRLPEERVRSVAVDTLRGLAFLHARQVCCRDVKLDNIMLRRKGGQAVLVDLGLACKADPSGTLKGRAAQLGGVGSMSNMAPEMRGVLKVPVAAPSGKAGKAREQRVPITVKCDVFSLGQSLANSTGVPMADIKSAPLRDLVTQLVARWPDARPSAEAALQHPFLAAAQ